MRSVGDVVVLMMPATTATPTGRCTKSPTDPISFHVLVNYKVRQNTIHESLCKVRCMKRQKIFEFRIFFVLEIMIKVFFPEIAS